MGVSKWEIMRGGGVRGRGGGGGGRIGDRKRRGEGQRV